MAIKRIIRNFIESNNNLNYIINKLILQDNNPNYYISNKLFKFCLNNVEDPIFLNELTNILKNISTRKDIDPLPIRKITNLSRNNFNREKLKMYTDNFNTPCVFTFNENFDKLKDLRENILNSDIKIIYCKETATYSKSANFDSKKHNIFNQHIEKNDLLDIIPGLSDYLLIGDVFISKKGDFTGLHNEIEQTLNIQIEGKKKWVLIDPKYSEDLLPVKSTNIINYYSLYSNNKVMFDKFHKKITRYEVELLENDCLFIPSWMYHAIDTKEDSLSLSLRYKVGSIHNELYFPENIFNKLINHLNFNNIVTSGNNDDIFNFIIKIILEKLIGVEYNIEETKKQLYYKYINNLVETYLKQTNTSS
uniref:JmjC domain-containing protein n=1 Tax=viral metagenome TaxID=1070528 RepID=A0A6C0KND0_9ZZZZ